MIKFWSYDRELAKYKKKIFLKIHKSLNSGQIFFGRELLEFEKKFTKKYKAKYGVAVGSGTDALFIALKSLGIKRGDEIITAANTAIPTISAIRSSGAIPKLVDIGDDYLIDCSKIERAVTKKTKVKQKKKRNIGVTLLRDAKSVEERERGVDALLLS